MTITFLIEFFCKRRTVIAMKRLQLDNRVEEETRFDLKVVKVNYCDLNVATGEFMARLLK